MNFLSLFAGIGGFDLGLERAGHQCVGQIEIDPFCNRVLAARWPGVPRSADVRSYQPSGWTRLAFSHGSETDNCDIHPTAGGVDLLVGGFPCQDLSVAGKRAGLAGERSGLFWEIVRIAKAVQPAWGLFENVPGLVSSRHGRDMWTVLQGLRECWPAVGYRILDSQYFGVAQRRRRVFFVCGPSDASVASILFESEGGNRHPAAGKEAGPGIAASLTSGSHGIGVNEPATVGVRRLTPGECELLQGFPLGWTCLCDEEPCRCPDSPRYRALGNAVTVNVVEWIGNRSKGIA